LATVRPKVVLVGLAVATACAGCGSSGSSERVADGASLFSEDCGMCHSLTGRPSARQQGGDLLGLHTTQAEMLEFVREMPVPHRLTAAETRTVADYVRAAEARGH
jgi:mono/diheme cytochrome c family protein